MANQVTNRTVNIFIESGQAQKALDVLINKEEDLKRELAEATNPKVIERLKNDLAKLQEPLERARKKVAGELTPSFKDLQATVNSLGNRLKRMSEEDADYNKILTQYREASRQLDEQRGKISFLQRAMRSFWQEAKTVALGVVIGNTIQSALQTVMGYVTGIVTGSARIADELADIEKTTGLTGDQVKNINKELGKIDTRTSREELRKLASEAGKLGEDTEIGVIKFVDQADKIRVALKEDLGEDAILDIAKTSKIFQVEMLNIASAINEIGASSAASETYSVDFLKRTGATGVTAGIAADELLGYSSALEQAGQNVEVSATALNTFFLDFISKGAEFGRVAGFADGELTKLMKERGTNEAFLQFLERLKAANPDADSFITKLRQLGIDGARGSSIFLSLANNIGEVRKQQGIANVAIQSSSSIMDEFNKKNNNAAAELDKFKKNFAGLFQSQSFMDAGAATIRLMNSFVNVLKSIPEFVRENRFALLTLAAGILVLNKAYLVASVSAIANKAAVIANTVATRASAIAANLAAAAQVAYSTIISILTGRLTAAAGAQRIWTAALSLGAGPLGVILVSVGALAIAIGSLFTKTKQLTAEQKLQAELQKRVADATQDTVTKVDLLTKAASDNNRSLDERKKALNALIAISPDYLNGLTLENIATKEGANIIATYVNNLKAKAEAEAKYSLLVDKLKQKQDLLNATRNQFDALSGLTDDQVEQKIRELAGQKIGFTTGTQLELEIKNARDVVNEFDNIKKLQEDISKTAVDNIVNTGNAGVDEVETAAKAAEGSINSLKEKLKDLQDARDAATTDADRTRINKDIADTEKKIAAMEGKVDKAVTGANKKTDDLLSDLQKIREGLSVTALSGIDREMQALDIKYAKLRERAGSNAKLLAIIQELYQEERLQVIRQFASKEADAWQKGQEDVMKKADEQFRKNIQGLKALSARLTNEINNGAVESNQQRDANRLAGAELQVIQSRGKARLRAELALLKEEERQALQAKDLTENQKLLIEDEYRRKRGDAEIEYWLRFIETATFFLSQLANLDQVFSDAKTQKENAELERDKKINDKKKANLEQRLKAGTITQLTYDRELQKVEKEREKKEKEIALKQFKREQRQKFVNAVINNAGAVATTLEKFGPPIPPNFLGIAAMGLTIATGLAQLITISRQKPPEYGSGGAFLKGPSHQDKSRGMPVTDPYTGRIQAYLEGGEGIGSRKTMNDQRQYNVTGTPSQIFSVLNGVNGGVTWTTGATIRPAWTTTRPKQINYSNVNTSITKVRRYYATGGVFGAAAPSNSPGGGGQASDLGAVLALMAENNAALRDTLSGLQANMADLAASNAQLSTTLDTVQKEGIPAFTLISEQEKAQARLDAIRNAATLKG